MHVKVNKRKVPKGNMPKLYKAPKVEKKEEAATDAVLVSMRTIQAAKCLQVGDVVICKKTVLPSHILVYFQSMLVGEIFHNLKTQTQEFRGVVVSISNDEVLIELEQKPENDAQKPFQKAAEFVAEVTAAGNKPQLEVTPQAENSKTSGKWNLLASYPKNRNLRVHVRNVVVCTKVNHQGVSTDAPCIDVTFGNESCGYISYKTEGNALQKDHIDSLPQQFLGVVVAIDDFLHIKVLNEFETPLTSLMSEPEVDINNPTYTVVSVFGNDKLRVGMKLTAKKENWSGKDVFGLHHSGDRICQISNSKWVSVPGTLAGEDASNLPDTFDVTVVATGVARHGYCAYIVQPVMVTDKAANLNSQSAAVPQQPVKVNTAKQPAAVEAKPKRYTVVAPIDTRLTIGMNLVAKKEEIPYAGGLGFDGSGVFNLFYCNQQVGTIASTNCMAVPNTEVVPIDKASNLPATFKVTVVDSGKTASGKFAFIVQEKKEE